MKKKKITRVYNALAVYDKHSAAEYLGINETALAYHVYVSKRFPAGWLQYGRLMWTKAQLDTFKGETIKPGWHGDENTTTTPAKFDNLPAGKQAYYNGQRIERAEREKDSRWYTLYFENGKSALVWNNVRLEVKAAQ